MKVKSVTDVITNSSNETFMVITSMTILRLKEVANAALELCFNDTNGLSNGEKKLTFDDVFELKINLVSPAEAEERWKEMKEDYPDDVDLKECKTLEEFALFYDSRYHEQPLIRNFTVLAKNLKYAKLAEALNHLDCDFYDLREVYC